eukprot:gene9971-7132_t
MSNVVCRPRASSSSSWLHDGQPQRVGGAAVSNDREAHFAAHCHGFRAPCNVEIAAWTPWTGPQKKIETLATTMDLLLPLLDKHPRVVLVVGALVVIVPVAVSLLVEIDRTCRPDLRIWLFILILWLIVRGSATLYTMHQEKVAEDRRAAAEEEDDEFSTPQTTSRQATARQCDEEETEELGSAGVDSSPASPLDAPNLHDPSQVEILDNLASPMTAEDEAADALESQILCLQKLLDIVDVFGLVWFVIGNIFVFNNLACLQQPLVFYTSLAYIVYAYVTFVGRALLQCSLHYFHSATGAADEHHAPRGWSLPLFRGRYHLTSRRADADDSHSQSLSGSSSGHSRGRPASHYSSLVRRAWNPVDALLQHLTGDVFGEGGARDDAAEGESDSDDSYYADVPNDPDSVASRASRREARLRRRRLTRRQRHRIERRRHQRSYWRTWLRHFDCGEFRYDATHPAVSALLRATEAADDAVTPFNAPLSPRDDGRLQCVVCRMSLLPPALHVGEAPSLASLASLASLSSSQHSLQSLQVVDLEAQQDATGASLDDVATSATATAHATRQTAQPPPPCAAPTAAAAPVGEAMEREEWLVCFPCGVAQPDATDTAWPPAPVTPPSPSTQTTPRGGTAPPLRHIFHARCLHDWLRTLKKSSRRLRCPLCRSEPYVSPRGAPSTDLARAAAQAAALQTVAYAAPPPDEAPRPSVLPDD